MYTVWFIQAYSQLSRFRQSSSIGAAAISLQDIILYWEKVSNIGPLTEFIEIISLADRALMKGTKEDG
jgi:hypothetical protein